MHVFPDIYLVGGLDYHLTVTDWDSRDCNVYVVDTGDGLAMVDCGCGETLPEIFEYMRDAYELKPSDLTHLLLTHAHFNHAEAAHALKANRVQIVAHADAAEIMAAGDERTGWYAFHQTFVPTDADRTVADGDVVEIGNCAFEVLHTPGHGAGCVAYRLAQYRRSIAFTGDVVLSHGRLGRRFTEDYDLEAYRQSLRRLMGERFDAVLPGHGLLCMKSAHIWVENCYRTAIEMAH